MRTERAARVCLVGALILATCAMRPVDPEPRLRKARLTTPTRLCAGDQDAGCRDPADVTTTLADAPLEILSSRPTPTGLQGARRLVVRDASAGTVLRAKWRALSRRSPSHHPAGELLAYHAQQLVLEPADYVTAARCFDWPRARPWLAAPGGDHRCAAGVLSYWLEDVRSLAEAREQGALADAPDRADAGDPPCTTRGGSKPTRSTATRSRP